jgi:GT2 family glycosyltransferase/sugar lactone lactonase YvrE
MNDSPVPDHPPADAGPFLPRVRIDGKFLALGPRRFHVKGVTYGTFAPDGTGSQFPALPQVGADFTAMAAAGINTVRVYTPPRMEMLDAAADRGLRLMVGVPWAQHVAFLDDARLAREARTSVVAHVRTLASHPAAMLFAVGNEIPPAIVRWHGRRRVEQFLRDLYAAAKDEAPDALVTYVNFPSTEYLDLESFDVSAFNVYLHRERDLRAYLARLQQIAGLKPLLLAEAGADSLREGEAEQARVTAMHVRAAFEEGLCGAVAFAWTDEWWRGGSDVTDWKFGLVDSERRPKPALTAVSESFAEAPFANADRARWPRVSVVVCAYNAADTIGECLSSLAGLTYPDVEVIVVNDGSKDATGDIARRFAFARVIDIPNGGLSAARNLGLANATGEIVAYTDADVRVDPDWLTYLVQPFLASDVVGSGGPNVVPADDPWMAQCVARAPGGPTHVLLDDRTAEHVPGCNMAFRRVALEAIGGFNPIYLRAGDDVDVCWRLQARGWRIGFAPSALVWHRHRSSVKAYWKQQAGYGEGETWLMHQHPDKFAGGHMIWHGRIYSPLPFVRRLTRQRVNTGVWGLAPFPSVYHTGAQPRSYLPHTAPWLLAAAALLAAGAVTLVAGGHSSAGWLMTMAGLLGLGITAGRCFGYARRTPLPDERVGLGHGAAWRMRGTIAALHFLQPLARIRGRIRGRVRPPQVPAADTAIPARVARPRPTLSAVWSALRLLGGAAAEDRFWSERWCAVDQVLADVLAALRSGRVSRSIAVADGWDQDRDLSIALGRWGRLDLSVVVEEHAGGRVLVRARTHLRPAMATVVVAVTAFVAILVAATSAGASGWWQPSPLEMGIGVAALGFVAWRTAAALAAVRSVVRHALRARGALLMDGPRPTIRFVQDLALWRHAARSALASLFVVGVVLGGVLLMRDAAVTTVERLTPPPPPPAPMAPRVFEVPGIGLAIAPNGDLYLSDAHEDVITRMAMRNGLMPVSAVARTASAPSRQPDTVARFDTPGGVAVAPNGDLFITDTQTHRVYRVDRLRGTAVVVAGAGRPGFDGDGGPATRALLNEPAAVAVDRAGNLFVADTANHRIRKVARRTGIITTVAGSGLGDPALRAVGDGGLAPRASLSWPMDLAVAPDGDLYVADTGHNRVRRVDSTSGTISTVAGGGAAGSAGDGGPAVLAELSEPTGVALVARRNQVTLYIADSSNGRVRVVTPDGLISSLALPNAVKIASPARVAYHPRGYLYVAGTDRDALAAISLAPPPPRPGPPAGGRPVPLVHTPARRSM